MDNIILATDSYKTSHFKQYPPGTTKVTSYIEARPGGTWDRVVFFGLQAFLRQYLTKAITLADVLEAETIFKAHGVPFNKAGWLHIIKKHHGLLPVGIEALPEGSVVPVGTPLVQIWNTDPECFWLTSYLETALLRAIWYPSTVATLSWHARQSLAHFVHATTDGDADSILSFMLHDFGARGVSSQESAMLGGAAHLINFSGTDTVEGLVAVMRYYDAEAVPAFSVPASEHSTMTAWGQDQEADAYANMMQEFPTGIVSIVADSYDYVNAVRNIFCIDLKDLVQVRAGQGRVVIRPDSGEPVPTVLFTLEKLGGAFGFTINSKGYKVLPDHVRILWGDGIAVPQMEGLLATMQQQGWAAENIVFGMGGALLQKVNRDSLRFAMKANEIEVGGEVREIAKQPKTDPSKASKAGAQAVVYDGMSNIRVIPQKQLNAWSGNLLEQRFIRGALVNESTFDQVRERAKKPFTNAQVKKVA
ncbi:nicotinamide phosphoribosyltransferase [Rhizobium rosettiformans]|uniref:Nicotinamide phosphoribosyltransferase n=2 Tax=Rhizobium rosettiformans TaxID=1368430 RepID=A0A4V4HR96_9HYPH|nr:nicotinate phosphoribosyltransferase [Rhizobium rosettiformans]MBB5276295.1 nicotinamide phosphoribosyltransferase [Rhizobium rosettiformans]THV36926.1 nicotinate phosphoribosyltransferase [Rhizobium rosettiformans W3]